MKKRLATLILASAMVLSMAACGNTTSSSKSTTSSKTTSSTTSSKAADSSTTTSSKAADSSTATASTPAESSTPATASTPAESSTPATASTPAESSTPATASTPAESSTPAEASTPAETTDSKTTAAEHTIVGLWRSTDTAPGYYTFYDDGFAIYNYYGSGEPTYTYTFENDVLTLDNGETKTVQSCGFDGTALSLKTEGVEFADTYTALVYSPDEGNIVGMWKTVAEEPLYYTFHEDGKGHVYQPSRKALSSFDYTIEGDQLKGTITGGDALDFDCTVSFSGDKLDKVLFQYNNGTGQGLSMERVLPENY